MSVTNNPTSDNRAALCCNARIGVIVNGNITLWELNLLIDRGGG